MKLRNINLLVSFKLILVNSYHILVFHKNVLQKNSQQKIKPLSLQNLHKLCSFFQNEVNTILYYILTTKLFSIKHSGVFLFFLFLGKSYRLLSVLQVNIYFNFLKLNLIGVIAIPKNVFIKKYLTVNRGSTNISFNGKLLTTPIFNSSSMNKYISQSTSNNVGFQFLRKNKVFNKGRYSRCRQNYRTGVYICMYLSVVCIFGLYFWFYKFSFNFTYL